MLEKTYVINHAAIAYLLQEIIGILVALPGCVPACSARARVTARADRAPRSAGRGVLVGVAATKADISSTHVRACARRSAD